MKIFNKQKKIGTIDFTSTISVTLNLSEYPEVQKQVELIHFSKKDLSILHHLQPYIEQILKNVVHSFYKSLEIEPSLTSIISKYSNVDRLKKTLYHHLYEMFGGIIDSNYIEERKKIALMHVKIGLEPKWYIGAFETLYSEFSDLIFQLELLNKDKLDALNAINRILNIEQQLVLEAYEQENTRLRLEATAKQDILKKSVQKTVQDLAIISEETSASVDHLATQTKAINTFTAQNLSFVTQTEEKTLSGQVLITEQMNQTEQIETGIDLLQQKMQQLQLFSNKIQEIINLVTSIANQTNLLALNASIEAARAGEHGVGFAVVASEVRNLSEETKKAIENVTFLIQDTKEEIMDVSTTVSKINHQIHQGLEIYSKVYTSFQDIVNCIYSIEKQSQQTNEEITNITHILLELNTAIEQIAQSSDELTDRMKSLF